MRVLIVGGYGVFGLRLATLLADRAELTILLGGRSRAKSAQAVNSLKGLARFESCVFDRDGDLAVQISALAPDVLVDCSGPFQAYGRAPWRLVEACIAARVHYLDLADGTDFVLGIEAFDAAARSAGVYVLTGVSTCPALTGAAVRALTQGWRRLDRISAGIAPSPHADVGLNVIRALASYAGRPVRLLRDGQFADGAGLVETRRETIAPPGRPPMQRTLFSLVDVPDLVLLPRLWPGLQAIWFGAGPRPEILHRMLNQLARLVSWGLPVPLVPLSGLFHLVKTRLKWGEDRGGMFVRVEGIGPDGGPCAGTWSLIAEGEDGPFIPAMAAASVLNKVLAGQSPVFGARSAAEALELSDYEPFFAARRIRTGLRGDPAPDEPLYRRLLGPAWSDLAPAVRAMHDLSDEDLEAVGTVQVHRGRGLVARLLSLAMRLPMASQATVLTVGFHRSGQGERWLRRFEQVSLESRQFEGAGNRQGLLLESLGLITISLALEVESGVLRLSSRGWSLMGIPMPGFLGPQVMAREWQADGLFRFEVEVRAPGGDLVLGYRGGLQAA
ncbi:MAG: DUF4166 domain-containing protein [Caulobacter sp.]|nr:DUF4166 domain-containing protein [Caulobacter sp.]